MRSNLSTMACKCVCDLMPPNDYKTYCEHMHTHYLFKGTEPTQKFVNQTVLYDPAVLDQEEEFNFKSATHCTAPIIENIYIHIYSEWCL